MTHLFDAWMRYAQLAFAATTLDAYTCIIRKHLRPAFEALPAHSVTNEVVLGYLQRRAQAGMAKATIQQHASLLGRIFKYAYQQGWVDHNPCAGIRLRSDRHIAARVFDKDQVRAFLDAAQASPYYLLYLLTVFSGLRHSELAGLRWRDMDFTTGHISIRQNRCYTRSRGWIVKDPKSAASTRRLPLPPFVLKVLHDQYAKRTPCQDLIFSYPDGRPWDIEDIVRRDLRRVLERAGLPHIRLHDLRHTHATLLLELGTPPKVVSERLGHSSVTFTMQVYSHVMPGMQEQAVARLEEVFKT